MYLSCQQVLTKYLKGILLKVLNCVLYIRERAILALGKNIKSLRTEKGWTQKELSEKLGVTIKTISYFELGERQPSRETLIKLAEIFGISVDRLLGNENESIRDSDLTRDIKKILVEIGAFQENATITQEEYDKWLKFIRAQATLFRDLNNNRI